MKSKLAIVTGNAMKFRELSLALGGHFDCEQKEIKGYHEIQGTAEEILAHKLAAAYEAFQMPVLVDDVSVSFDMWNGFPGPYMKDFLEHVHPYELGQRFSGERMRAVCRLGIAMGRTETILAEGSISGCIVPALPGEEGIMHFDVCVQADGMPKRMQEYSPEEKNEFSHRGLAIKDLLSKLQ
jgi:non-canonical purine NTP pyrophosphatase (RdgB/HAM1 family)